MSKLTVKLTRYQADMVALVDQPFGGCEVTRICGVYIWVTASVGGLLELADHYGQRATDGHGAAGRAEERIRAALTKAPQIG
jgi:hypothetical protein